MRKVQLLLASTIVGIIAVACGSTTSNNAPGGGNDAGGGEDAPSSLADANDGASSSEDGGACVFGDADIATLTPVDAALGDSGSVGSCIACAKANCSTNVTACDTDCECNTALVCIFDCISGVGNTLLTCAEQCAAGTGITKGEGGVSGLTSAEYALLICADKNCATPCDVAGLGGGGGGNKDAGHDASDTDASDLDGAVIDGSDDAAD